MGPWGRHVVGEPWVLVQILHPGSGGLVHPGSTGTIPGDFADGGTPGRSTSQTQPLLGGNTLARGSRGELDIPPFPPIVGGSLPRWPPLEVLVGLSWQRESPREVF